MTGGGGRDAGGRDDGGGGNVPLAVGGGGLTACAAPGEPGAGGAELCARFRGIALPVIGHEASSSPCGRLQNGQRMKRWLMRAKRRSRSYRNAHERASANEPSSR